MVLESRVVCHGEEELVSDGIKDLLHKLGRGWDGRLRHGHGKLVVLAVTVKLLGETGTTNVKELTTEAPLASEGVALNVIMPVVAS